MGGKPEYCSAFPGSERTGVLPQILNAERLTYFHGSLYEGMRAGVVVTQRVHTSQLWVRFLAPIPTFVHLRYE